MLDIIHCLKLSLLPEYAELRALPTMTQEEFAKALKKNLTQKRNLEMFIADMKERIERNREPIVPCTECSSDHETGSSCKN